MENDQLLEDKLTPAQEKMKMRLAMMYVGTGAFIAGFKPYPGLVLMKYAGERAEEVVRACRHNKVAWGWLERIVSGSDLTACLLGHGMMFYAIMAHSGRMPKNEQLLAMTGYTEEQVLSVGMPMTEEQFNAAINNGHSGNTGGQVATGI